MKLFRFLKKKQLKDYNSNDVNYFSFDGIKTKCKIISFYDGDTCKIIFKFGGKFYKLHCRLLGIDTPEIKSNFAPERMAGQIAKAYVSKYNSQILDVHMYNFDKYGRTLIKLFEPTSNISINDILIKNGMGYEYDGKTKKAFLEWYKL